MISHKRLSIGQSGSTGNMHHPMDTDHAIYDSCADAIARGGIRPNPDEPIVMLLSDGTKTSCEMKRVNNGPKSFCPPGMYGIHSKCFSVHNEYVTNSEASRYIRFSGEILYISIKCIKVNNN